MGSWLTSRGTRQIVKEAVHDLLVPIFPRTLGLFDEGRGAVHENSTTEETKP